VEIDHKYGNYIKNKPWKLITNMEITYKINHGN